MGDKHCGCEYCGSTDFNCNHCSADFSTAELAAELGQCLDCCKRVGELEAQLADALDKAKHWEDTCDAQHETLAETEHACNKYLEQLAKEKRLVSEAVDDVRIMANELVECRQMLERARNYRGVEAYACPLCEYKEGKFVKYCELHRQLAECQRERDALREALPDGGKLVQLAAWLDLKFPDDDNEVQEDLRRWGYEIQALSEAKENDGD